MSVACACACVCATERLLPASAQSEWFPCTTRRTEKSHTHTIPPPPAHTHTHTSSSEAGHTLTKKAQRRLDPILCPLIRHRHQRARSTSEWATVKPRGDAQHPFSAHTPRPCPVLPHSPLTNTDFDWLSALSSPCFVSHIASASASASAFASASQERCRVQYRPRQRRIYVRVREVFTCAWSNWTRAARGSHRCQPRQQPRRALRVL